MNGCWPAAETQGANPRPFRWRVCPLAAEAHAIDVQGADSGAAVRAHREVERQDTRLLDHHLLKFTSPRLRHEQLHPATAVVERGRREAGGHAVPALPGAAGDDHPAIDGVALLPSLEKAHAWLGP